mmetsp:Transcript_14641/g.30664  ORF Transcript_14641/g.30664 Transcript_14641/m.30664 type:complete len:305 (-) Transcript_14641:655-1569(-)
MSSTLIIPRNSGAYVEPAARAIWRLASMRPFLESSKLRSSPETMSNHLVGTPVAGSLFSSRPKVLRYSPVIEEAVRRNVCVRPALVLPIPSFNTISSTFDFCKRAPCVDTNLFINCSKRLSTTDGSISMEAMKCAKILLLGLVPTFGLSLARSTSSTAASNKVSGQAIHRSSFSSSVMFCNVCVIIRTKIVDKTPRFPGLWFFETPKYNNEFRPITGNMRSSVYSCARRLISRRCGKVGRMSRMLRHSFQPSLPRKQATRGMYGDCANTTCTSRIPASWSAAAFPDSMPSSCEIMSLNSASLLW